MRLLTSKPLCIEFGDPVDDLAVATVLMVVGGQLILLKPRKVSMSAVYHNMF